MTLKAVRRCASPCAAVADPTCTYTHRDARSDQTIKRQISQMHLRQMFSILSHSRLYKAGFIGYNEHVKRRWCSQETNAKPCIRCPGLSEEESNGCLLRRRSSKQTHSCHVAGWAAPQERLTALKKTAFGRTSPPTYSPFPWRPPVPLEKETYRNRIPFPS